MPTILCVEDNEDNLFVLQRRLSRAGFDVKVATNGAHGVEWARTLRPDAIVMDLNLPGLDGFEATRRLKSQPETQHIPIIVLSAHGGEGSRAKALSAGCDDFQEKPADFEALIGKIQGLLRNARP